MTANQFDEFWSSNYPLTPPISHLFRKAYPERWLRIHGLPESRRYPQTSSEWIILLNRYNTLINDLLPTDSIILVVTGDYAIGPGAEFTRPFTPGDSLAHVAFTSLKPIPLETVANGEAPDEHKSGDVYRPVFSEIHWQTSTWDNLLKEITEDKLDAFFISIANKLIIAPYDGGVDIILKDEPTRNMYKAKYKEWLSTRADGL